MIANITTGNYCVGMVKYNDNKTKEKIGNQPAAVLLDVNFIPEKNVDSIIKTIDFHNRLNENISKPNIHISLNFHKNDLLQNNEIVEIANDYMQALGYEKQPYAIYRHFDKEHPHVHVVSSQIDTNGEKINDSYLYRKSQRITRELELKYGITIATEQQSNKIENKPLDTLIYEHLEHGKHSLTGILSKILLEVLAAKPCNEKEFDFQLSKYQTKRTIFETEGEKKGNYFHLLPMDVFNEPFIKDKGISGSDIDVIFSYDSIQLQLEINATTKKNNLKQMMGKVYSVVNKLPIDKKESLSTFILDLKKKGVVLETKRKQTGDDIGGIYGLNFKDSKTGINYTASELKIKTKEFLEKFIDDEKQIGAKIEQNKNDMEPKSISEDIVDNGLEAATNLFEALLSSTYTQEEQVSLAAKKRRKKKR